MSVCSDLAASGPPSAETLAFPLRPEHCRAFAARLAPVATSEWSDRHMPFVAAAIDLLDLDDACFKSRLAGLRDREGQALILELVDAIDETSGQLQLIFQALGMVNARVRLGLKAAGLELPR